MPMMPSIVSTGWLAAHLGDPDLRIIDATWYMPQLERDARAEFAAAHIPGAVFFDIDAIADHSTSLPHMLPVAEAFASAVGALGIGNGDRVVAYGGKHLVASARVWWTFRVFGHDAVAVLDGGLPRWRAEGRSLAEGVLSPASRSFTAKLHPDLVRDLAAMRDNVATRREQVVDARSHGRFVGTEPEPRPGLRSGHIPGSVSLSYDRLFRGDDGTLLPVDELRRAFAQSGVDLSLPIVTTCGSGVTAAVLALGLSVLDRSEVPVYDGSWTEWAGRDDTPVER
jgi:thiosulfate/3-mercaptopyruvate sulfurtransferase